VLLPAGVVYTPAKTFKQKNAPALSYTKMQKTPLLSVSRREIVLNLENIT